MSEINLVYVFFLSVFSVLIFSYFEFFKKKNLSFLALIFSFLISFLSIVLITRYSGKLPVSGDFEKFQMIVFYLLCILLIQKLFLKHIVDFNLVTPFFIFVFFVIILFQDKKVSENLLIYSRFDVLAFFQFRMLSMAFFIYVISLQIKGLINIFNGNDFRDLIYLSRNFSLLGAASFLGGEFFGSLWALNGWGDPWRWSKGFLIATAMFLLSMLASHFPNGLFKNMKIKLVVSIIPFLIIVLLFVI